MKVKKNSPARAGNKEKTPYKMRRGIKIFILLFLFLLIAASGVAAKVISDYISEAPPFDPSRLETVETTYLYDSTGKEIATLHDEQHRVGITLDEVPEHVQLAFIAIEDERFYQHFGFDVISNLRAAYANYQAGTIVQGASTISQQLVQGAFLSTERSYKRKIQEIWLAIELEQRYEKNEILEMYLNRIYFGNSAYGVEAAAQTYFGKSVAELNITEGAMLGGVVRSPNFYNPIDNKAAAEERMKNVLANMLRLELISEAAYNQAVETSPGYSKPRSLDYPYPHFVDYVLHTELVRILRAIPEFGTREEAYRAIYTGGLRVYTTLEPHLQNHVENVLGRADLYPSTIYTDMNMVRQAIASLPHGGHLSQAQLQEFIDEEYGIAQPQAAIVTADPQTGQIKALGGGREYRKNLDELLRFSSLRQPGSAIKPIITYGPAFEEGTLAGAGSTLDDSPYIGPQQNWFPENFDYRFRGLIPAREALIYSYNIPAVRAYEELGPQIGADYAERMGISTFIPEEKENLSLTLGGLTLGVSAIDMAQAYSVLANGGLKIELHTIKKVVDRQGNVLYEHEANPERILSPQSAFLVNDILQGFVTGYLGRALQIDRPVAAKTGTTDNWKDVYLAAYTPNLVATFWMGYDEPRMGSIQQGWRYSTAFLREVFLEAFETLEIKDFEQPDGLVRMAVCSRSGLRPNEDCQTAESVINDFFLADNAPTEVCGMHDDRYYNRPPYIITDGRWSSRGGPERGPEDAAETPSRDERDAELASRRQPEGPVIMPDVVGLYQALAESTLRREGLQVGFIEYRHHNDIPVNRVIAQRPEPGTELERSREVRLIVSRGPE